MPAAVTLSFTNLNIKPIQREQENLINIHLQIKFSDFQVYCEIFFVKKKSREEIYIANPRPGMTRNVKHKGNDPKNKNIP
jgi:hypothetical protein